MKITIESASNIDIETTINVAQDYILNRTKTDGELITTEIGWPDEICLTDFGIEWFFVDCNIVAENTYNFVIRRN